MRPADVATGRLRGAWALLGLALLPSVAQLVVGMWIVFSLESYQQKALMGGDIAGSLAFVLSLVLALWLMHLTAAIAFGTKTPQQWRMVAIVMALIIVLMTHVERTTRAPVSPPAVSDGLVDAIPAHE